MLTNVAELYSCLICYILFFGVNIKYGLKNMCARRIAGKFSYRFQIFVFRLILDISGISVAIEVEYFTVLYALNRLFIYSVG